MNLTGPQQEAVLHMGSPALVVAGAGSGKTRTLTSKISYLINQGFDSERILAITFTNKAANEMKERLVQLTGIPMYKFPWVRTYHSACLQILKQHFQLMGFASVPQIYTPYQQEKIVKEILIRMNFDKKHTKGVLYQVSLGKNSGDPMHYYENHPFYSSIRMTDVYNQYEAQLMQRGAVDFDNILLLTRDLLREHADIRCQYQQFFSYVLVDEYQDTNDLQEDLTGLLVANGNLFCVGDDWQAIYSFRGSNVSHFLSFMNKYPGSRIFRLEQNFRSADEIVQVANRVIRRNENRVDKHCFSDKQGGLVETYNFDDENEEAGWVAAKIRTLNRSGIPFDRLAVLYRTKFCSLSFEKAFRTMGLPYEMLGGKGFFDRKEILDLVSYLTAAQYDKDDVSFERIINIPKRGLGPGAVKKIGALRQGHMSLQDAARKTRSEKILSAKLYKSLDELIRLIDDIKIMPPAQALTEVIQRVDYMDYLEGYAKGDPQDLTARRENIDQLIYSATQKATLVEFLEEAALIKEDRDEGDDEEQQGVKLSTIHASKGLEFHTVFVIGCEEQLFPHWKSMESALELEEERRLMYVSMTRAEHYLFLTSADYRRGRYNQPSRFLEEIAEDQYEH